jgi:hypothetical protein
MLWPGSSGPNKGPDFDRCHLATRRQICSVLNVYAVIRTTTEQPLVAVFAVIDFSLTVRHSPALLFQGYHILKGATVLDSIDVVASGSQAGLRPHLIDHFRRLGLGQVLMKVMRPVRLLAQGFRYEAWAPVIGSSPLIQSSGSFSVFERVLVLGLFMANLLERVRERDFALQRLDAPGRFLAREIFGK